MQKFHESLLPLSCDELVLVIAGDGNVAPTDSQLQQAFSSFLALNNHEVSSYWPELSPFMTRTIKDIHQAFAVMPQVFNDFCNIYGLQQLDK
jgi:hypothetical protein